MQQRSLLRSIALGAAVAAIALTPQVALAGSIRTLLNGNELVFDAPPLVENERTLVPVRGILEPLGATFTWDGTSQTVTATLGSTEIIAVVGSDTAKVNGREVKLDAPVRIVADRTMVPLRFFAENLGMHVGWDHETRTIAIEVPRVVSISRDSATLNRKAAAVVEAAQALVGLPYAWGGSSPDTGFDCSGFVRYLGEQFGVSLSHSSFEQFSQGVEVALENLRAGDLVFFETYTAGASHVGVYDGKGNFIHAQSEETGVRVTPMSSEWWAARYLGARRVFR